MNNHVETDHTRIQSGFTNFVTFNGLFYVINFKLLFSRRYSPNNIVHKSN